jgi:hypothetical protein
MDLFDICTTNGVDHRQRRNLSLQERFQEFDRAHPDVYALFKRLAIELRSAGRDHYGAKGIMEVVRFNYQTSSAGGEFKINNSFTSRYVRKLVYEMPEFAGFFETRRLKSL